MPDKRLHMPNELCQFTLNWSILDGDIANNVLYLAQRDCLITPGFVSFDDAGAHEQALNIAAAFNLHIAPLISNTVTLESVDWVWNESTTSPVLHVGTATGGTMPWSGAQTAAPTNSGVSLAVRMQTGLGGRGNHGRFFLVGMNAGLFDSAAPNELKAGSISDFNTHLPALLAAINNNNCVAEVGNSWTLVVASFILHGALLPTAVHHDVTSLNLKDHFFDFQRRRAPAHSRHH
jgi:hypothetical protein